MNNKNYTSLAISQELKELGFKGECDAWWSEYKHTQFNSEYNIILTDTLYEGDYESYKNEIPAYTAQDILDVLPSDIKDTSHYTDGGYEYDSEGYAFEVSKVGDKCFCKDVLEEFEETEADTLADALGKMLIELIKKGVIKV